MSSNAPPAKRQRRLNTVLSDEDELGPSAATLPLRRPHGARNAPTSSQSSSASRVSSQRGTKRPSASSLSRHATQPSPKSSPEKSKKSKKLSIDDSKNGSLHSFFGKVTEEERWRKRSATPELTTNSQEVEDDIIDDDSMDEALSEAIRRSELDLARQGPPSGPLKPPKSTPAFKVPAVPGQKFRKPATSRASPDADIQNGEEVASDRPWAEKYAPSMLDEVAVHKKKLLDVQKWFDEVNAGRINQRLLVLKGPAGSGKSTAVQLLARARRCEIVFWQNPDTSAPGTLSSGLQFAEFISRGGDYGALSLNASEASVQTKGSNERILLVEDFPASLTRSSNALESFRSVLLHAVANAGISSPFGRKIASMKTPPIVLIISETLVSSSTSFADSFTAQRLLGPELVNHSAVTVIEFNPVAPTFMSKAIDLVIKKEARDSKRRRIPGAALLSKLAEMGDIRNAINSLQFLCTRGDDRGDWSGTVAANAKRGAKGHAPLSAMEEESLRLLSSRETTLDMFHAAGKVCYNKREDPRITDPKALPPPRPPDHLQHLHKPKVSQVDIDDLLNETGTDIQTFVSTVQQNYILSCNHEDFVDYFDGCAGVLSDAELLDPDSRSVGRGKARAGAQHATFQLGSSDSLRQDEISFQVSTRGVLFNLPFPVSRAAPPGSNRGAAFKMYYPASLRLWRPIEETMGLLEHTIAQMSGQSASRRAAGSDADSVTTWKSRATAFGNRHAQLEDDTEELVPRLDLSKDNLLVEILPYLTHIRASRGEDTTTLKKLTQMRGFNTAIEGEPDDDAGVTSAGSARLTQKVEAVHKTLEAQRVAQRKAKETKVEDVPVAKLFIEDDDIEDD